MPKADAKAPPLTIEETIELLLKKLTVPQREALLKRQLGLFDPGTVLAKGQTVSALRRHGLVESHKRVTPLGEKLCERLTAA